MKRIGIYFFCVIAIGCVTSSVLFWENEKSGEISIEKQKEEPLKKSSLVEEPFVEVSDNMKNVSEENLFTENSVKERFFVKEEDGYLVIYDCITMKRYDETAILVEDLPAQLQEKMKKGLFFASEEALYEFLENYSS